MDSMIFGVMAVLYVVLLVWLLANHQWKLSSVIVLVIVALIYDNVILAIGKVIGQGRTLEWLSIPRFWLHGFFTPMLIFFSLAVVREAGNQWSQKRWILIVVTIHTILAILFEYIHSLANLSLDAKEKFEALSYAQVETSGPPIMIILVVVAAIIAGVILWWKSKWPWMFVGILLMSVGSAIPQDFMSNSITNVFELLLLSTLVWTKKRLDQGRIKVIR